MTTKEKLETVFGKIEQSEFINAARNKRMTKEQQELIKQSEKVSKLIDAINSVISLGYDSEILKNALFEYHKTS